MPTAPDIVASSDGADTSTPPIQKRPRVTIKEVVNEDDNPPSPPVQTKYVSVLLFSISCFIDSLIHTGENFKSDLLLLRAS
jgi:hypothetical protein